MDCLKILIVGSPGRIAAVLEESGHLVIPVPDFNEANEALLVQRFDAVLVAPDAPFQDLAAFVAGIDATRTKLDRPRTPIIGIASAVSPDLPIAMFNGVVQESSDPDALTLAIARLASAVAIDKSAAKPVALDPALPVLDEAMLREQVADDTELLTELIDLYLSERAKQSAEMASDLASADYNALSRVAHTIKGSLGSLHANAAHATAQSLEMAARNSDAQACQDFLPALEQQLDLLDAELRRLRARLAG